MSLLCSCTHIGTHIHLVYNKCIMFWPDSVHKVHHLEVSKDFSTHFFIPVNTRCVPKSQPKYFVSCTFSDNLHSLA